jgi:predicted acyltransferase
MTEPAPNAAKSAGKGAIFASAKRLASLDIFRGFIMASMVMVNNQLGPGAYTQLRHAAWDGLTFTDLVFPSFLWIAGLATTLSTANRLERGQSRGSLLAHAFRRAVMIFLIGLALNALWRFDLSTLRIPGVLQRIALCYLAGTLIFLWTGVWGRIAAIGALFAVYWVAMAPDGYAMEGNAGAQLDLWLMPGHLYTPVYDPEGLLTTLPAIATFLFGVLAGDKLRARKTPKITAAWLFASGAGLVAAGYALSPLQPINKALWTVPYTLIAAGLSSVMFAACYWIADAGGHRGRWTLPFTIFGVNALAVYVFHSIVESGFNAFGPRDALRVPLEGALGPVNGSLVYSLIHVALCFAFAWLLWRRKIFVKL